MSILLLALLVACDAADQRERRAGNADELAKARSLAAPESACQVLRKVAVPERGSLVVIVSDAMRRDAPGIYGGAAHTPHFDAFARQHLRFTRAVSQAPWTKPSVASLLTSTYPSQHGVSDHPAWRSSATRTWTEADILSDDFVTLAELLQGSGMRTAAFVANPWMGKRFGFAQGFREYDDSFADFDASGASVSEAAAEWLEGIESHERFFLYLHYIDAHAPYGGMDEDVLSAAREQIEADVRPIGEKHRRFVDNLWLTPDRRIGESDIRRSPTLVQMSYQRGVENFDTALGTFLAALGDHVLDHETAVFVTSDHGEALFEMGFGNHNISLRESEIAIPLVARLPGVEPERAVVDCLVGLVDVMPTICDYFDLACPEQVSGYSVLAPDAGVPPSNDRYMVAEGLGGSPKRRTIQNRRFKLVGRADPGDARNNVVPRTRLFALYDLLADPTEETNLIAEGASSPEADAVAGVMGEALLGSVGAAPDVTRGRARLDERTRERLKAIGYLQD